VVIITEKASKKDKKGSEKVAKTAVKKVAKTAVKKVVKTAVKKVVKATVKKEIEKESIKKSSSSPKIKAIFFDFWGTVVENGVFPSPVRQVKMILRLNMPFSDYIVKFESVFMTRTFNTLYEAFENVTKEFSIKPPSFVYDKLVGMWNKNTILCHPYPETEEVLKELKKNYKLVLISNTDSLSVPQLIEKFKLSEYFDGFIYSFETGLLKTNPEMFKKALDIVKLKPEEVLMVGDSLETDVLGAEKAGIKAVLVDRRDRREYKNKIIDLTGLKKFL